MDNVSKMTDDFKDHLLELVDIREKRSHVVNISVGGTMDLSKQSSSLSGKELEVRNDRSSQVFVFRDVCCTDVAISICA